MVNKMPTLDEQKKIAVNMLLDPAVTGFYLFIKINPDEAGYAHHADPFVLSAAAIKALFLAGDKL